MITITLTYDEAMFLAEALRSQISRILVTRGTRQSALELSTVLDKLLTAPQNRRGMEMGAGSMPER